MTWNCTWVGWLAFIHNNSSLAKTMFLLQFDARRNAVSPMWMDKGASLWSLMTTNAYCFRVDATPQNAESRCRPPQWSASTLWQIKFKKPLVQFHQMDSQWKIRAISKQYLRRSTFFCTRRLAAMSYLFLRRYWEYNRTNSIQVCQLYLDFLAVIGAILLAIGHVCIRQRISSHCAQYMCHAEHSTCTTPPSIPGAVPPTTLCFLCSWRIIYASVCRRHDFIISKRQKVINEKTES